MTSLRYMEQGLAGALAISFLKSNLNEWESRLCPAGCAFPTLLLFIQGFLLQAFLWSRLNNATTSGALVIIRLVVWPLWGELFMAPLRAVLRSIPEEWVEKDWLSMAAVPMQLSLGLFGRLFMYRIVEPSAMILVNFALLFLELAFRLTVSHRDKFYSRILGCMPQSVIKSWFGQKHNVKFRCDNLIGEMALEYYCMFAMFVQQFALVRRTNPEEASNAGHGERSRLQLLATQVRSS